MKDSNIFDIKELYYLPPLYGGISVSLERLIRQLTIDGFVVGGFYTPMCKNTQYLNSELFELEPYLSIKHLWILPKCLRILRKYKVLHSHYSLEHMLYMWCFLHFLRKKMIITVHNSMVCKFYQDCDFINRFFLRLVASNPNVTWIAVSEQAKTEMNKLPVSFNQPIHVIPAHIPNLEVKKDSVPAPLANYMQRHEKNIVFYGHGFMLHEGNDIYGFSDAIKLFAELVESKGRSIGLVLCISDVHNTEKIDELHKMSKAEGVDDLIYWQIGPLSNMNAVWSETDVYIRPTYTDGDSVAVREALDMGVQVVASDVCWRPDGVMTYQYGNMNDFICKVNKALQDGHAATTPDYTNYNKLKDIYIRALQS